MDATASLNRLLAVLAERDIGLGYDDLAWLFESPQTKHAMISWVHEYLNSTTLLTPEELDIHAYISQSNYKPCPTPTQNAVPRPIEDNDFENAIHSLEASTAAIEKQTAILEAQRDALKKLQTLNREPASATSGTDEKLSSQARSKAQLDLETSELSEVVQQRLGATQRQADSNLTSLKTSARRQLDKDDRLFDGLQKVIFKLAPLEPSEKRIPDFDALAHALVRLESKIVKDRTNTIYLDSLQRSDKETDGIHHRDNDQAAREAHELTEELESLISEVDSVLEMVVHKQHRAPIVRALTQSDVQAQSAQQKWLEYVKTTLSELAHKTDGLSACTQDALAYAAAVSHVSDVLTRTLPSPSPPRPKSDRRRSTRGLSPRKAANPILHRQVSQGGKDPALEMLGYHGIRIPADSGTDAGVVSSALESAVLERQSRLQGLERSTEQSVAAQVAESVNEADGELQNLHGVLYAYSPYATLNLADRDAKERLESLDREIARLGDGIRKLDVDRLAEAEHKRLYVALGDKY